MHTCTQHIHKCTHQGNVLCSFRDGWLRAYGVFLQSAVVCIPLKVSWLPIQVNTLHNTLATA